MKSDIEIAQNAKMLPIIKIAEKIGLTEDDIEQYGKYKAKISLNCLEKYKTKKEGKLVLVTSINPTPAGEGKSTVAIGLAQALNRLGKNAILALREPSLGPVFGIKGGATGGGYSQVVPMEDINLHFTGDMHAITAANNLLSAAIDNHIYQGNELNIDPNKIVFKRAIDMNDRALREITVGQGKNNGIERKDSFQITVASEIMAILCLSISLMDLKEKMGNILIGYTKEGKPVMAKDLKVEGAMALLMKDAIKPNLVQTLENTPAIIHGGPFANIAHGCNSIIATKMAQMLGDITITEAGFGADLGAEKFFNIKCRYGNLKPDATVLVATIRALKHHGGVTKENLNKPNIEALKKGMENLEKQIENIKSFKVPLIIAINEFKTDTKEELELIKKFCQEKNIPVSKTSIWEKGGQGGLDLATKLITTLETEKSNFEVLYKKEKTIKEKINIIAKTIYGAKKVNFTEEADEEIKKLEKNKMDSLPICIAKTQYSLSDNKDLLGRPKDFEITIKKLNVSNGAGFIVALAGSIMTMPGLPKVPAANNMDITEDGTIKGLF